MLLFAATALVFYSPYVQTRLAGAIAAKLSRDLNTTVQIGSVDIDFFSTLVLEDFLIKDQQDDTLAAFDRLGVGISAWHRKTRQIEIKSVAMDGAYFHLQQLPDGGTNLDFLTRYFAAPKKSETPSAPYLIDIRQLEITNGVFHYKNPAPAGPPQIFDPNDILFTHLNVQLDEISLDGDSVSAQVEHISFVEKSGLQLKALSAFLQVDAMGLHLSDLRLHTAESFLGGMLEFNFDSWKAFQKFNNEVLLHAKFNEGSINLRDLSYFYSGFVGIDQQFELSGTFRGSIANLKSRNLTISTGDHTILTGDIDLSGLPNMQNTFISADISKFSTAYKDLLPLLDQFGAVPPNQQLQNAFYRLGSVGFSGSFTGFLSEFVAYGTFVTDLGVIKSDLQLLAQNEQGEVAYDGTVAVTGLAVGPLFQIPDMKDITASLELNGTLDGAKLKAAVAGNVERLAYADYVYTQISVDGELEEKRFSGRINSQDPNALLNFEGLVDFSRPVPVLDCSAYIHNLNLSRLNLVNTPKELVISSNLFLNASGNKISNLNGIARVLDAEICFGDSSFVLGDFEVSSIRTAIANKLSLSSDVIDLSVTGNFFPQELPQDFINMAADVMPSLAPEYAPVDAPENFDFSLNFKKTEPFTTIFLPNLQIANGTTIYGSYNSGKGSFGVLVRSDQVQYGRLALENFSFDFEKEQELVSGTLFSQKAFISDSTSVENLAIAIKAYNDLVETHWSWQNAGENTSASTGINLYFDSKSKLQALLLPGQVSVLNETWHISDSTTIFIDSSHIEIPNFVARNDNQLIQVSGAIGKDPKEKLRVKVVNLDLNFLNNLKQAGLPQLDGLLTTQATISGLYTEPVINSTSVIKRFNLNGWEFGDLHLKTEYYSGAEILEIDGKVISDSIPQLSFYGDYLLETDSNNLDVTIYFDNFDLAALNSFKIPEISNISGMVDGDVAVGGTLSQPRISGLVNFDNARFKIDYLNTYYIYSDEVRIENDWFGIDYKPIFDEFGHEGRVVASVFHQNYTRWNMDVAAEVDNFLLLNTRPEMNSLYYGTAYASGNVQISGYTNNLSINIDAVTNKGTSIKLPLGQSEEVVLENFVSFVSPKDSVKAEPQAKLDGIQLTMNIEATPDAEVQLIFDEQTGDILRGRGSGILTFDISPAGDFTMFGRYEVSQGDYLFTLQSLINKRFRIVPGGKIFWYGNPYDADVDITAVYNLRAPLYPIMIDNPELYHDREQVELNLELSGKLMNPNINFKIKLPQATTNERAQLQSALSTTQQLNQQVFALLMLNRFLPVNEAQRVEDGSLTGLGSTTYNDFISNQISNWLSQISDDFEIGFNFRPGDELTNREIAVALSTQLFNERLQLSGNFGVTDEGERTYNAGQSGLVGDFMIEYMITPDGKFRLRVFNQTNSYEVLSTTNSLYTQGVGLVYQEDFNTFSEFINKLSNLFKNAIPKQ